MKQPLLFSEFDSPSIPPLSKGGEERLDFKEAGVDPLLFQD